MLSPKSGGRTTEGSNVANYSERSAGKLKTCHIKLQVLFREVVKGFDNAILEGRRDKAAQDEAYRRGHSKLQWPDSKHNVEEEDELSEAVDVAPYPIDWTDRERFHYFAGYVKGVAAELAISIRWGGDWNNDTEVRDNTFDDLVHFELEGE